MAPQQQTRIVLADADDAFRSFLAGLLRPRGVEVVQVNTARAAERVIANNPVTLAVIDANLEDQSGTALVGKLRSNGSRCAIIFMEAGWKEQESYQYLTNELGVRRVMHKPFSAYEFIIEVDAALGERRDTIAPPSGADSEPATSSRRKRSYPSLPSFEPPGHRTITLALVGRDDAIESMVKSAADDAVVAIRSMSDGDEVIRRVDKEPIDGALFILDADNPDVGLAEATEVLCSEIGKSLPVGFVCRRGSVEIQVEAIHAGGVVFLSAPIEPLHLQQAATSLAQLRRGPAPQVTVVGGVRQIQALTAALREAALETEAVANGNALLEHLSHSMPDLVLFDVDTPGVSATDVCKLLRASPRYNALPVVLLTGHSGEESRIASFEAGADDLIVKPMSAEELVTRVLARIQRVRAAREVADRDPRTGLLHRHAFVERAHAMTAEAGRAGRVVAICVLGPDAAEGAADDASARREQAMTAISALVASSLREYDLRARWDEEEIILALADVDAETAEPLVERIVDALAKSGLPCSAGVAIFPSDENVMESLVRVARRRWRRAHSVGTTVVTMG